jgi:hypothetical protein
MNTRHVLRKLMEHKFQVAMEKLDSFEVTLRIDAHEFVEAMEAEISELKRDLKLVETKLAEEVQRPKIHETVDEFGDDVVVHQKMGNFHRLVLACRPLPQKNTEWVPYHESVTLGGYVATWNNVEKCPF